MNFSSYYEKKKKKKSIENNETFEIPNLSLKKFNSKSNVKTSNVYKPTNTVTQKNEKDKTYFDRGVFSDGYQFGDITKTILGTAGDIVAPVFTGMFNFSEGILDTIGYGAAEIAERAGKKGLANYIRNETENSLTEDVSWVADELTDDNSLLGSKAKKIIDPIGQGLGSALSIVGTGQLGGMLGLGAKGISALTTSANFMSSVGSGVGEAYQYGANKEDAWKYGALQGAVNAGSEMLFGGLGKGVNALGISRGISSLDDAFAKKISNKISNQFFKNLVQFGVKSSAEGIEEVLAGVGSAAAKKLTFLKDEELTELIKNENLLEQFVLGTVTSGIMQSGLLPGMSEGSLIETTKQGRDFISEGLSKNEKKVIDAEYKNRIAEKEKSGKKITIKQKNKLYNSLITELEKGYISTDLIESVLGGDTYMQYQSAVEKDNQMKELQKEYDLLYQMKNGEKSDEQIDRQKELKQQLGEYKNTSQLKAIKEQLSNQVSVLAKADRLGESYNESARRKQKFEADLSKFSIKEQEVVKKAIDSEILNNTNKTHDFVRLVAKLSADKGVSFDFVNNDKLKASGLILEGLSVNGFVDGQKIGVNIDSNKALNTVVGHEITHILEKTEQYTALAEAVKNYATSKGIYDAKLQSISKLYENIEGADIDAEVTADLVGELLFTDSEFVNNLSAEQPGLFKKIYNEIKYLCKIATAGSKEARELEKVKKTFEEAFRQKNNTATDDGVKYSIAGVKSKTHNFSAFEQAIRLEDVGKATSEEIRQQTGWYRGYDGKWRYEINDKDMKIKDVDTTSAETTLGDVLEHQVLFDAYPQLKDVKVFFDMDTGNSRGSYNYEQNAITINSRLKLNEDQLKRTLIHEIQHAIQHVEGFSNGASPEYWESAKNRYTPKENEKAQALKWDIYNLERSIKKEFGAEACKNVVSYYDLQDAYFDDNADSQAIEKETERIEAEAEENGYTEVLEQYYDLKRDLDLINLKVEQRKQMSNQQLYMNTAGEIESRDVSARVDLTETQRKEIRPNIDRTNVVFADGVSFSSSKDLENTEKILYNNDNPLSIINRADTNNNSSIKWVYDAKIFSITENKKFYQKISEINLGSESFSKTANGEYMISIENKIVFTDGNYDSPYISEIVEILTDSATEFEDIKRWVFSVEKGESEKQDASRVIQQMYGDGNIITYNGGVDGVYDWQNGKRKGKSRRTVIRNYLNKQYRGGNDNQSEEVKINSTDPITKASSTDDVFFDASKKDTKMSLSTANDDIAPVGNNVYGEDVRFEAPLNEYFSTEKKTDSGNEQFSAPDFEYKDENGDSFIGFDDEQSAVEDVSDDLTIDKKAATHLTTTVISNLGIGKGKGNRKEIMSLIQDLANGKYRSKEDLLNAVSDKFGTQYIKELNDEFTEAKEYLKNTKIYVPDSVKSEFGSTTDYLNFQRINFGKLHLSKDGTVIDSVYQELNEMYPHLFPDDIWNETDQLMQIADIASQPKYNIIPEKLDLEILENATDLIYDSVNEYVETQAKIKDITPKINAASISDEIKEQIKENVLKEHLKIESEFNSEKNDLIKEYSAIRKMLTADTYSQETFIAEKANALYDEIRSPKKGIRASDDLSYLIDSLDNKNWNPLRVALLNVRNFPDRVVNEDSGIETIVRDYLQKNYNDKVDRLNNLDAEFNEKLSKLEEIANQKRETIKLALNGKLAKETIDSEIVNLIGDTSLWQDKKFGFQYKTTTEKRNFRDIIRDKNGKKNIELADKIYDYFMGTYNHNEADLNREANKKREKFAKFELNKYEDIFVQIKGEFLYNPDTELTQHDIDTFLKLHGKNINEAKVDKCIDMARETYDELIKRVNEVLIAHGMKPIEYRKGYFPHFTDIKQNWLQRILNIKPQNNEIPTDKAGLTENFKPNRSWQSFNKQRISDNTDYSFMKGFDNYLQGSLDWIYHIDDIMKRRVFENRIRYDRGSDGVKAQVNEIYNNSELDTNEKQEQIDLVFKKAGNPLNNFIIDFRTKTNTLAGKKSSMDRGMEEFTSRKFYSTMTNLSNRITGNMVAGSISSALTNFIPITQSWGQVSPISSLVAMREVVKNNFNDDGTINKSDFLTNRLNQSEKLYQTGWDKVSKIAGWMMEAVDNFTSQVVWRSKFNENMSKRMSEAEAIKNADEFAEGLIGGRSRGNMPTIFDSKHPFIKMATAFQLEVNNQYQYMFKDLPQDMKNESKTKLLKGYAGMFIGAYAYNALYSALVGRDAAFDPIGIIEELLNDLGFGDDEEDDEIDAATVAMNLFDNIVDELPFISGFVGGGRVPLSSALPYGDNIRDAFEGTVTDFSEGDFENLTKEWLGSAGAYLVAPVGGGQLRKTIQGVSMFDDDLPLAGSYTDSGDLRFTVDDDLGSFLQSAFFGQYASSSARTYFDEGRSPLKEKKQQELKELDISIEKYWEYQDGLKALGEKATLDEKAEYIANLEGYTDKQKNIMINNLTDRKEPIDLSNYNDFEGGLEELDFSMKSPEKYTIAKSVGGYDLYKTYSNDLFEIKSDKDKNGKTISGSRKNKVIDYIDSLDIEYGCKIILYKSEYPSDDTFNTDILNYLNERDDLTYEEKLIIAQELGFTIHPDGRITW